MPKKPQTFENHGRLNPLYHLVASPLTWGYFVYATVQAVREPSGARIIVAIWALAIAVAVLTIRTKAITLQNRLIRLEMRLRLREVLPAAMHPRIRELTVRQLIGLRFAGDAELPTLVERTLNGEFPGTRAIKRAVTDWQPDHLRV